MTIFQDPRAWPIQFCRGQWKEQEREEDRRRDGKITSWNGREWDLEIPRGQWKTGTGGKVLLQCHLWCPDDSEVKGLRWDETKYMEAFLRYALKYCGLGGNTFVPQVPGYFKTHIVHSFLTILNYKTVCACRSSIMDIPPVPNQPKMFKFPQRFFGQKNTVKRSFQSSWFATRTWLHNDEANGLAYCHVCMLLIETEVEQLNLDKAFILDGFSNWKDGL